MNWCQHLLALSADDNFGHSVSIFGDYAIVGKSAMVQQLPERASYSNVELLLSPRNIPTKMQIFGWSVDISSNAIDRSGDYDIPIPGTQFNAVVGAPTSNAVNGNMTGGCIFLHH